MKAKYCRFCRKEFIDDSEFNNEKYCSEDCKLRDSKAVYSTISIKHVVRNRLIFLQNAILEKTNNKVSYTNLIDHVLDITEKILKDIKLSDRIINDYNYYL